jgi:hypothetical protein
MLSPDPVGGSCHPMMSDLVCQRGVGGDGVFEYLGGPLVRGSAPHERGNQSAARFVSSATGDREARIRRAVRLIATLLDSDPPRFAQRFCSLGRSLSPRVGFPG